MIGCLQKLQKYSEVNVNTAIDVITGIMSESPDDKVTSDLKALRAAAKVLQGEVFQNYGKKVAEVDVLFGKVFDQDANSGDKALYFNR